MRSRVEIVARKSDHICVVRDVPDTRSSWYQRQQQQQQQHSLDLPQVQGAVVSQGAGGPAASQSGGSGGATGKPSFAALLGKHPAIKEEPTTPGGSLVQTESGVPFGRARSPATRGQATGEQFTQLISMISELKSDIRQDLGQLSRRVDSMEASMSRVSQTVGQLDKHHLLAATADTRRSSGTSQSGSRRGSSSLLPAQPGVHLAASVVESSQTTQVAEETRRERSKSPHKHHHHHHHHHHRKASHPIPESTPAPPEEPSGPERAGQVQQPLQQLGPHIGQQPVAASHRAKQPSEDDDDQDATSKL